ncbi:kinase-like domain-containing protein [Zopfochytrium polystomum]|nr:kinase-like domain-containing protein [Zopfochytrium polystomum]
MSSLSVLRLVRREDFDTRLALHYLYLHHDNLGIQYHICEAMKSFPSAEIEFLLPQLIHLLISRSTDSAALEDFIMFQCEKADHFAILTLWQIRSYASDFVGSINNPAVKTLRRLYQKVKGILFDLPNEESAKSLTDYGRLSPLVVGIGTILGAVGLPAVAQSTQPMVMSQGRRAVPLDAVKRVEPTAVATSNSVEGTSGSTEASTEPVRPAHVQQDSGLDGATDLPRLTPNDAATSMDIARRQLHQQEMRNSRMAPSFEDLSHGRAFAKSPSSSKLLPPPSDEPSSPFLHVAPDSAQSELPATQSHRTQYFERELEFITHLSLISDRLRTVPKPSRQRTLIAELEVLNHNLPAAVCIPMWCEGGTDGQKHHLVVRVPPSDAVILNSADRVPYLVMLELVEGDIENFERQFSEGDETEGSDEDDEEDVDADEASANTAADSPLGDEERAESGTPPTYKAALDESMTTADEQHFQRVMIRRNGAKHSSEPRKSQELKLASLSPAVAAQVTNATAAVEEFTEKMRTAAIMLAQLYQQQQRELMIASSGAAGNASGPASPSLAPGPRTSSTTSASSAPNSPSAIRKMQQKINASFDVIRNKLVQEMAVLESKRMKALEQQRAVLKEAGIDELPQTQELSSDADERQPEGSELLKDERDKDDPSAAVFKELWDDKCARIQRASPYGHHPSWKLISVIVKSGSDLRQEVLALQVIKEMQRIWKDENVPVWVSSYRILVTSDQGGLVETVQNTISLHSIKKEGYRRKLNQQGVAYTLYDHFIRQYGHPGSDRFKQAQDAFMRSLAGYSIVCYLLQVKDRHNGNILIDHEGHQVHIDFGFMLSNSPGSMGFELAPFKLPQEFIDILGGTNSEKFKEYRNLCKSAFLAVRRRWDVIVGLVEVMEKDSTFPCFTGASTKPSTVYVPPSANSLFGFLGSNASMPDSAESPSSPSVPPVGSTTLGSNSSLPVSLRLRERFGLSLPEKQIRDLVDRLVDSSVNSMFTRLYDAFQWYSNGIL